MLTQDATSVTEAVLLATNEPFGVTRNDIERHEIEYEDFMPTVLSKPNPEDSSDYKYYAFTITLEDDVIEGFAISERAPTYGRPVSAEIHAEAPAE